MIKCKKEKWKARSKMLRSTNICEILNLCLPNLGKKKGLKFRSWKMLFWLINPALGMNQMKSNCFLPLKYLHAISRNLPRGPSASIDAGNAPWLPGWSANFFAECFALAKTGAPPLQAKQTWQLCMNLQGRTHPAGFCSWNCSNPISAETNKALI